jgi:hypothetical protein
MIPPPYAVLDPTLDGLWINHTLNHGYALTNRQPQRGWFGRIKMVYDFEPHADHPLLWIQAHGTQIAAGFLSGTDGGSVPVFAQGWLPKDGALAYYIHDFAFAEGGLFFRYRGERQWTFRRITRKQADALLRVMLRHDPVAPVGRFRAWVAWSGVRARVLLEKLGARQIWHDWQPYDIPRWPGQDDGPADVDDYPAMGVG